MTAMMAAVYHGRRDLRLTRVPIPEPRPDELLLRVHASGVCGTDAAEWAQGPRVYAPPLIPGHELAGRVVGYGADVSGFPEGTLVACGAGYVNTPDRLSRSGRPSLSRAYATIGLQADGGFAQYCAVPARACLPADDVLPDTAALAQPMAIAVHATRRGRVATLEHVVVLGVGGIGAFAVVAAAARGAHVTAIDPQPERLLLAERLGAACTLTPPQVSETGGVAPPDAILECSGAASAWELAVTMAAPGCRIVIVGLQQRAAALDLRELSRREHELIGTNAHDGAHDLSEALRLLASHHGGWSDVAPMAIPLAGLVPDALAPLAERRATSVKTLVDPWTVAARPTDTVPTRA